MLKKFLLDLWVSHRVKHGKRKKWIGDPELEKQFIRDIPDDTIYKLKYIADKNALGLMWDYQRDSKNVIMVNGGGDCNNINRCWHMKAESDGKESYLITWLHKPLDKKTFDFMYSKLDGFNLFWMRVLNLFGIARAHTTSVFRDPLTCIWFSNDYGLKYAFGTFKDALEYIAKTYMVEIAEISIQDWKWDIVVGSWKALKKSIGF